MNVRTLLLLAPLLAAGAGCRSARGDGMPEPEKRGRDYTSVNRSSLAFLFGTAREARRLRRTNLRRDLDFAGRAPGNRQRRRESVAFAWETFWQGTFSGFRTMVRDVKEYELKSARRRMDSIRFGFLDSGE